jgi:hypothetical protein
VLGVFFLAGVVGAVIFGLGIQQRLETRSWKPVPAQILVSSVRENKDRPTHRSFEVDVRYAYEWQGVKRESRNFSLPNQTYTHRDEVWSLIAPFPVGAKVDCRVNPDHPESAVLQPGGLGFGWLVIIPALVAAFAACGLIATWAAAGSPLARIASLGLGVGFSSIFVVVGAAVWIFLLWPDVQRGAATRQWVRTPCTILASAREVSHSSRQNSDTVRARVDYRYTYGGQEYVGDRIQAMDGFASNRWQEELQRRFTPQLETVCYVNPQQPGEAVLLLGTVSPWASGIFGLVFIGVGGFGVMRSLRGFRKG